MLGPGLLLSKLNAVVPGARAEVLCRLAEALGSATLLTSSILCWVYSGIRSLSCTLHKTA